MARELINVSVSPSLLLLLLFSFWFVFFWSYYFCCIFYIFIYLGDPLIKSYIHFCKINVEDL